MFPVSVVSDGYKGDVTQEGRGAELTSCDLHTNADGSLGRTTNVVRSPGGGLWHARENANRQQENACIPEMIVRGYELEYNAHHG